MRIVNVVFVGRSTYVSRRRAGWDHRASIRRATATVRRS